MGELEILYFRDRPLRTVREGRTRYISVVDALTALDVSGNPGRYWSDRKRKLAETQDDILRKIVSIKLPGADGKLRSADAADPAALAALLPLVRVREPAAFADWLGALSGRGSASPDRGRYDAAMPLLNTAFSPGEAEAVIRAMPQPAAGIAQAEYFYFSGQAEEACRVAEPYRESEDPALWLSARLICCFADLTLNRIPAARQELTQMVGRIQTQPGQLLPQERALQALFANAAATLLHLPVEQLPDLRSEMRFLPEGLRLFAGYLAAHQAYLDGAYGQSVGIAEHALFSSERTYPIAMIYLHMIAVMSWMSLKEPDKARAHFQEAWAMAQPDGLIEAFGEHHGLLQGMLEICLKKENPRAFRRIIDITYKFSYGWRRIHNPDARAEVADNLTTTEFTMAMLACRGWINKEIAAHMGVTEETVKSCLSGVYSKLGISGRDKLKKYMLK